MTPFEVYQTYLALKRHFTQKNYDYHKYNGKTRSNIKTFYNRKDRFFFEKLSRNKSKEDIINYFLSNFVSCGDPQSLWIGNIIKDGEKIFESWNYRINNLSDNFKSEMEELFSKYPFDKVFKILSYQHPIIVKEYLTKKVSIESLLILNKVLDFVKTYDDEIKDPVWEQISIILKKYDNFISINTYTYKMLLKQIITSET